MKKHILSILIIWCFMGKSYAQPTQIETYPPHWWVNMKWNTVNLLIRNPRQDYTNATVETTYKGVVIKKITALENPHYIAVDITISPEAKAGDVILNIGSSGKKTSLVWPLKARRTGNGTTYAQGLSQADVMYLIMPDRFSNGNPSNDQIKGMKDQSLNRDSIYYRHGGDLAGIISHLDYLQSIGVTALWLTPVLENDMPDRTEHGYAITNHFRVDPRLGGSDAYKKLSNELHRRGMKLVQDAVYNHTGLYHTLVQDKPVKDWLHEWPSYTNTNWRDQAAFDPHGIISDKKLLTDGWFTPFMPDLNHENNWHAQYLIQQALWNVEEFGVDAWRIDTYIYNDLDFINRCNQALLDEYPKIFLFGEALVHSVVSQAYFAENIFNTPFKSNVSGMIDFQSLFDGILPALNEGREGVNKLYQTAAQDFVYQHPENLVILLDNHDLSRFFTLVGKDVRKQKIGFGWLYTFRGIPQLYYGSEVLMSGSAWPRDGHVRLDFPGGWEGDVKNAFSEKNLSAEEKEMLAFVKKLGQYRKTSPALTQGLMKQIAPVNELYIYFRYTDQQTVMVVINTGEESKSIALSDYSELTKEYQQGKNVLTGKLVNNRFNSDPLSITIIELTK